MADPRIDYCCEGDAALKQHFQLTEWRDFMELVCNPDRGRLHLSRYISQNVPGTLVPEQAARHLLERMKQLRGESSRQPTCSMVTADNAGPSALFACCAAQYITETDAWSTRQCV